MALDLTADSHFDPGIADILAAVSRPDDLHSAESAAVDHQQLTRFWVAERGVPEVLPWPGTLMDRVLERVRRQVDKIEELASLGAAREMERDLDMGGYADDGVAETTADRRKRRKGTASSATATSNELTNATNNLKLSILQSDLSRTQFLVRSILRQRLAKLTKYPIHYLRLSSEPLDSQSQSQSQSQPQSQMHSPSQYAYKPGSILSEPEHSFLAHHHALQSAHYASSFLSYFPDKLRRLDDTTGGVSMVEVPETKEVVFVRCLAPQVRVVVPLEEDGVGGEVWTQGYTPGERIAGMTMRSGEIWLARWEGVREAWRKGDLEVL
ncbi:GINS complex subunit [Ascosphaera acerosa]|nr:GINS complex subunit [Ascosphaera acerosa]